MSDTAQSRASAGAPPAKGPIVWLDMDQRQLDDAYDQSIYAPNAAAIAARREESNKRAQARLGAPLRLAYGASEIEGLDLYRAPRDKAPILVFIHGGAWRAGRSAQCAYMAETFVGAGAHFAALDFNNVDETGGDLFPMADQVRRACAWLGQNAARYGGDPDRLYLSSHSSGSHLGGCIVTADWRALGLPDPGFKAALLSSGMYELHPVRLSKRSKYVAFTDAMEQELSPMRRLDFVRIPLVLSHGSLETPEFQRQTRDFHAALRAAGKNVELITGAGYNHFEIQETLANPYGLLGRAALTLMGLV
jgi:arylformamidase